MLSVYSLIHAYLIFMFFQDSKNRMSQSTSNAEIPPQSVDVPRIQDWFRGIPYEGDVGWVKHGRYTE